MRQYLKKILALTLAVALPFALWFGVLLAIPDHRGGSIASTIRYKADLLQTTEGPRIIFAGGSSSPYGTVCAEVAQQLDCNAICIGATAYLGLPFYLRMLEVYAEEGDIIVLAPEHSLLTDKTVDYSLVWEGAGQDADVWRCMPFSYLPGLFSSSTDYLRLKLEALSSGAGKYNEAFGPLGDVVLYRESQLAEGYLPGDPITLSPDVIYEKSLAQINRFSAKMERRGVTVFFAFAPADQLAVVSSEEEAGDFAQQIEESLEIPAILPLSDALMEGRYFYNSNNHLTTEGALINTQNLIDGLRAQLGVQTLPELS